MALEKIRQAVLEEARAEAARIIEEARKNKASFLKAQEEAAGQEFARLYRLRVQAIEEEYHRKLIQRKGIVSKQILDKRNALVKSLFEKAKRDILAWSPEQSVRVMGRRVEKAAGNHKGKIRVHPEDKDVFQKILAELNQSHGDANITVDENTPLLEKGGFIFVSANFEVDQTLETMLGQIEYEMLPAIASDLFPE